MNHEATMTTDSETHTVCKEIQRQSRRERYTEGRKIIHNFSGREREKETERARERQGERETDRETERERGRERNESM